MVREVQAVKDLRVSGLLMAARVRSDWQYRTSFFTYLTAQVLVTSLEFIALVLLLRLVPDLGGWTGSQAAFLYGMAAVPFAVTMLTVASVDRLANYVKEGTFDRLLLRPIPAVLQIIALEFELRRLGRLPPPLLILIWAAPRTGVDWDLRTVAALVLALVCGTCIYSAIWIAAAAMSFWMIASQEATNSVTYGGEFANHYPLHLYRGWIRAVIGWSIPLAFVAYVPSVYLFESGAGVTDGAGRAILVTPLEMPSWLFYMTPAVALAAMAVALTLWSRGVAHYQSTGS
ncbi:MAG: ABC transporter permease [Acidimicrobiales bacterium]